jgi:transposase
MSKLLAGGFAQVGKIASRLYREATGILFLVLESWSNWPLILKKIQTLHSVRSESALRSSALYRLCIRLPAKWAMFSKKTLKASEQEREDIAKSRDEWRKFQKAVDARRLVFLDESALKTNMTRRYGRARNGNRCLDSAPCGHWETVTILSSIRLDGTTESLVFEGAVDRKMFDAYIKESLAPTLRPGDIVVMDNLNAHKSQKACDVIRLHQAEVIFLPAYSPDFNPIEKMWSKMKQILRGIKPRTEEELFVATATALDAITVHNAQGWFNSCEYTAFQS